MKCKYCGTEFDGNFCPKCGAKAKNVNTSDFNYPGTQKKTANIRKTTILFVLLLIAFFVSPLIGSRVRNKSTESVRQEFYDLIKDGDNNSTESAYQEASDLMKAGDYSSAAQVLLTITDYKDSGDLLKYCDFEVKCQQVKSKIEAGNYESAYNAVIALPNCIETGNLLMQIISAASVDLNALENDFEANRVRAENTYANKFFSISGEVMGTSTSILGEDYLQVKVGNCGDYAHCYDLTMSELSSVEKGDNVTLVGNFDGCYGWIGIDFKSCTIIQAEQLYPYNSIRNIYRIHSEIAKQDF